MKNLNVRKPKHSSIDSLGDDDPDNYFPPGMAAKDDDEESGGSCKVITKTSSIQTNLNYYNITLMISMTKVYIY